MQYMEFHGPGFSIDVPTTWLASSSTQFQVQFAEVGQFDGVPVNFIVALRPVQPDVTVADVAQEAYEKQASEYPGFKVVEETDFTPDGGRAFKRRYRWQSPKAAVVQTQCFIIVGAVLFTLTATRPARDAEAYDAVFDDMIRSFRIHAKPSS